MSAVSVRINDYEELCLLTSVADDGGDEADNLAMAVLVRLAVEYEPERHNGRRMICHFLLQSAHVLRMLQTTDFCDSIRERVDVYPFTMDEVWSRCMVLDYEPISIHSEQTVHLVILGMTDMAEMVAMNAAQVAHYPNFIRDTRLRTRITLIDEQAEAKSQQWVTRYQQLYDNSYYRIIKPAEDRVVSKFHLPAYKANYEAQADFVDVEWEFVEATIASTVVREKLRLWSGDRSGQLLTLAFCHRDANRNLSETQLLPQEVYTERIPVYAYMPNGGTTIDCVRPFGMTDRGYDVSLPLVQMAKTVKYVYDLCYQENDEHWSGRLKFAAEIDMSKRERLWQEERQLMRMSNIYNAMTIASKMRSVGLNADDWDKFYDIPQQEIELLSEVEHNRWCVERLIMGWRPCNVQEQAAIDADIRKKEELKKRKIHYDLRPYRELRPDATGKPVAIYDLCLSYCLPLIAKSFADEKGGGVE